MGRRRRNGRSAGTAGRQAAAVHIGEREGKVEGQAMRRASHTRSRRTEAEGTANRAVVEA